MKFTFSLLLLLSSSLALGKIEFDLDEICSKIEDTDQRSQEAQRVSSENDELIIIDGGFCKAYLETVLEDTALEVSSVLSYENETQNDESFCNQQQINFLVPQFKTKKHKVKPKWTVRLYASHSFTHYFKTDIKMRSARFNVDIDDYEFIQRRSEDFFTDHWKDGQFYRMVDEPTNTFTLSISNGKFEYFLAGFHPKFLQAENQVKYMKGTIDGVAVDGVFDINRPFDGYNQTPGEMELVRNQNTHLQMYFKAGVGYRIPLLKLKAMEITTVPSLAMGIMGGKNITVAIQEGQWWEFDEYVAPNWSVQGFGGTASNRIEINLGKKRRFGIFYETGYSFVKQEHEFMQMEDGSPGTQKYNLQFLENTVGFKFILFSTK